MKKIPVILILLLLLGGCGSGGLSSSNTPTDITFTLATDHIESTKADGDEIIETTASCSSGDLFAKECLLKSVTVTWDGHSQTYPLNYTIKISEEKTFNVSVITDSERTFEPFSYLSPSNPSAAKFGWTAYSETIGDIGSQLFALGTTTCQPDASDPTKQLCSGEKAYQGYLPPYTKGTLKITDGDQVLTEDTFGVLSGSGTGYIDNMNFLSIQFDKEPAAGAMITALFIKPLRPLAGLPQGTQTRVVYGSLKLRQEDVNGQKYLLNEADETPYAEIVNRNIVPLQSWGFNNAAVTASYSASPFTGLGGEVIGKGDGRSVIFDLKTKYAPIVDGSLHVFAAGMDGDIQYYNKQSGDVTVRFPSPVPANSDIKATYYISRLRVPMTLSFETNNGAQQFPIVLEVTAP